MTRATFCPPAASLASPLTRLLTLHCADSALVKHFKAAVDLACTPGVLLLVGGGLVAVGFAWPRCSRLPHCARAAAGRPIMLAGALQCLCPAEQWSLLCRLPACRCVPQVKVQQLLASGEVQRVLDQLEGMHVELPMVRPRAGAPAEPLPLCSSS